MAAGSWDTSINILDIPYCPEITMLGFRFTSTVARSGNVTWSRVAGKVKALARDLYGRDLCLTQRIQYVRTFLLSKIWHTSQIFPSSKEHERQLLTAISWYIYMAWCNLQGVCINLVTQDEEGGLDLIDVAANCRALFLTRFWAQGERDGSLTAEWLNIWALLSPRTNPPHIRVIPRTLEYLRIYFHEWPYMKPQRQAETPREFKRRVYNTLQTMSTTVEQTTGGVHHAASASYWLVTIVGQFPQRKFVCWSQVSMVHGDSWHNTHGCEVAQNPTDGYGQLYTVWEAGHHVTSPHRMWDGTGGLGMDLHTDSVDRRTDPRRVPTEWLLRPCFQLWPRQRRQEILWILANMVSYVVHQHRTLSVMAVLSSCVGRDGRPIRIQIRWNPWGTIWRCSKQAAPAPRTNHRHHPQFSPTVPFPPPFLPTVIPILIRIVFFQLTGILAVLIKW